MEKKRLLFDEAGSSHWWRRKRDVSSGHGATPAECGGSEGLDMFIMALRVWCAARVRA